MTRMLDNNGFTLNELSRAFGVTPRAIRFYDELGIVRPGRNSRNGRVFDAVERERLRLTITLRRSGVAVRTVRNIIQAGRNSGSAAQQQAMVVALVDRLDELAAEREALTAAVRTINSLIGELTMAAA